MIRVATASVALLSALTLLCSSSASAQPRDEVAAEALFIEGRRLQDAGNYNEAAAKFALSDIAAPSVGARINLGDCNREVGKTASAWIAYRKALALAKRQGDATRAQAAAAAAAKLSKKLMHLQLDVAETDRPPGLVVTIDGEVKSPALFGQRLPIDPGAHVVSATAPDRVPWKREINAKVEGTTMLLEVPTLKIKATPEPTPEPLPKPETMLSSDATSHSADPLKQPVAGRPPDADSDRGQTRRRLGLGIAGAGLASAATGLVFGTLASRQYASRTEHCTDENICSDDGLDAIAGARSKATLATVLVGVGAAATAIGAVVYFTAPSRQRSLVVLPVASESGAGVALIGSF